MSKFKEGDTVEIRPLTEVEKKNYPSMWVTEMNAYVGKVRTIERDIGSGYYTLKNAGGWTWYEMNLEPPTTFDAF